MKSEGARRLMPGALVWWRHRGVHEGVVLALYHREGLLVRVQVEAREGARRNRYLSIRRLHYRVPEGQQLSLIDSPQGGAA